MTHGGGLVSNAAKHDIAARAGVVSVGESVSDGEDVLLVTLEHGTEPDTVGVPQSVEGVPVEIDYSSPVRNIAAAPATFTQPAPSHRPAMPGMSTANIDLDGQGTLGPLMIGSDGHYWLTSNWHVWVEGEDATAAEGDRIAVPATVDSRYVAAELRGWDHDTTDSAFAEPVVSDISAQIRGIGHPNGSHDPEVGEQIQMSGSTSGVVAGEVTATNVIVSNDGDTYYDQVRTTRVSQQGDSGAPVVGDNTEVVGVTYGQTDNATYHNPISHWEGLFGGMHVATEDPPADGGGDDECSPTYAGIEKERYSYEGTQQDLFDRWQACEITTDDFQFRTEEGDGTTALVPPDEAAGGGEAQSSALPLVLGAGLLGGLWYRHRSR